MLFTAAHALEKMASVLSSQDLKIVNATLNNDDMPELIEDIDIIDYGTPEDGCDGSCYECDGFCDPEA